MKVNISKWIKVLFYLSAGILIITLVTFRFIPCNRIDAEKAVNEYRNLIEQGGTHRVDLIKKILYLQLKHKSSEVRRNIVEILGELNEPDTPDILWNAFVHEKSSDVKCAALTGIAEFADKSAAKYLVKALKDKDISVRKEAALACGDLGEESVSKELEEAFRRESNKFNKLAIASSMIALGDEKKAAFIENLALHNADCEIRRYAAELLSFVGSAFNITISADDINQEKDPDVKVWSACALAIRGDSSMVRYLRHILSESKSPPVRSHAAHVLCDGLGDFEYVYPFLLELLTENDPRIREDAVEDLADFKKPQLIPILGEVLLSDSNIVVREIAAWALGKIGNKSALAYLEKGLYDDSAFVRTGVIAAIYKILTAESSGSK